MAERVQALAVAAFDALGCEGLARVDFFVTGDGRRADERGQHDAGLHPDLDVPADVGEQRAWTTPSWSTG